MRSTKFFVGLTMCFLMTFSVFVSYDIFFDEALCKQEEVVTFKVPLSDGKKSDFTLNIPRNIFYGYDPKLADVLVSCNKPVEITRGFKLQFILPDFEGKTNDNERLFDVKGYGSKIMMHVHTYSHDNVSVRRGVDYLASFYGIKKRKVNTYKNKEIINLNGLEPVFSRVDKGLIRYGFSDVEIKSLVSEDSLGASSVPPNLYYTESEEGYGVVILCDSEYKPIYSPMCNQRIILTALELQVDVFYSISFLSEWDVIDSKVNEIFDKYKEQGSN